MLSVVETGEFGLLEPLDREIQVEPKWSADPRRRRLRRRGRQEKTPNLIQVRLPPRDGVVDPIRCSAPCIRMFLPIDFTIFPGGVRRLR